MAVKTYWNGEESPCRRVVVRVGPSPRDTWWCARLVGQEHPAVEVTYGGDVFYLSDEGGAGWHKVTTGHGGPQAGHSSLPDDSVVLRVVPDSEPCRCGRPLEAQ